MNSAHDLTRLQHRLDELLGRLDRMMAEREMLQRENEQLRRSVEALQHAVREGLATGPMNAWSPDRSPRHATPVDAIPDLSRRGRYPDGDPYDAGGDPGRPRLDLCAPEADDEAGVPQASWRERAGRTVRTERMQSVPAPVVRVERELAPGESTRLGRALEPSEFDRVVPDAADAAPRPNFDLGYLDQVGSEQLDQLPYGLIILDYQGNVLFYNETESRYAGFSKERVVGKNFFAEVAPCTRVREFEGAFRDFVAGKLGRVHFFDFIFHFRQGSQSVLIGFSPRRQRGQVNVMLTRK